MSPKKTNNSQPRWKAEITFVPFDSEIQRKRAYKEWARLFLLGKKKEMELKGKQSKQKDIPSHENTKIIR